MRPSHLLALGVMLVSPLAAQAGEPAEAVRYFYDHAGSETDPANRDRFTDPARAMLDMAETNAAPDEAGCIDFVLAIDAQDLDDGILAKTLTFEETAEGDAAMVMARFRLFADQETDSMIEWDVKKIGGAWKVADIASKANDWRLSAFDCSAKR